MARLYANENFPFPVVEELRHGATTRSPSLPWQTRRS